MLGLNWQGCPLLGRGKIGGWERSSIQSHGPRPVEVALDAVSDKSKHGNTSMLDFRMAQKSNSGFVALAPEVSISQFEGIVEFNKGVQVSGKGFKIGLNGG